MNGDKLVIELKGLRLALDTAVIDGIVEAERVPFLPGQSSFVSGIISLRGEPVTVIDLGRVFGREGASPGASHKIIVAREKSRLIGLDIGACGVSFIWEEEIRSRGPRAEADGPFISGNLSVEKGPIKIIDWKALFAETARLLSSEDSGV